MKVKDVMKRIEDLDNLYNNMIKIQECCLRNEDAKECIKELESKAQLNNTLRNLASLTAAYISDEVGRLNTIIENTVVKID